MRRKLERYAQRLWYRERPGRFWMGLSQLYRLGLGSNWQRPNERPPCPVIVVGNLSVGGTGKTPVVMALVRHLLDAGLKPAIISRGYGGQPDRPALRVEPGDDPRRVGDEPALMAASLKVPVWVARRRRLALQAAVAAGAELVIADDGLQHRGLPRSFEIVLIDGERGLGNGHLLPAGPLRCPAERLAQADRVLLRAPCTASGLPAGLVFELRVLGLTRLDSGKRSLPTSRSGQTVTAVCGIGHPGQFATLLESLGMQVDLQAFPDHHSYRNSDLAGMARPIITTAKDAVKLRVLTPVPTGVEVLEIDAALPAELLDAVVSHVREFKR